MRTFNLTAMMSRLIGSHRRLRLISILSLTTTSRGNRTAMLAFPTTKWNRIAEAGDRRFAAVRAGAVRPVPRVLVSGVCADPIARICPGSSGGSDAGFLRAPARRGPAGDSGPKQRAVPRPAVDGLRLLPGRHGRPGAGAEAGRRPRRGLAERGGRRAAVPPGAIGSARPRAALRTGLGLGVLQRALDQLALEEEAAGAGPTSGSSCPS